MIKVLSLVLAVCILGGCSSSPSAPVQGDEPHDAASVGEDVAQIPVEAGGGDSFQPSPEAGANDAGDAGIPTDSGGGDSFQPSPEAGGEDAGGGEDAAQPTAWTWGCWIPGLNLNDPWLGFWPFYPCNSNVQDGVDGNPWIGTSYPSTADCASSSPPPPPAKDDLGPCQVDYEGPGTFTPEPGTVTHICGNDGDCAGLPNNASSDAGPFCQKNGAVFYPAEDAGYCAN